MGQSIATLREMLARLRRKAKGIDGPTAMILDGLIDLAATQQQEIAMLNARLAQRGAFPADVPWLGPEPISLRQLLAEDGCEHQQITPCLVCVTRREWAVGAKL